MQKPKTNIPTIPQTNLKKITQHLKKQQDRSDNQITNAFSEVKMLPSNKIQFSSLQTSTTYTAAFETMFKNKIKSYHTRFAYANNKISFPTVFYKI